MDKSSSAKAVADLHAGIILARIDIAAPPERVFQALASEEIVAWWGDAETYHARAWKADVRPGGHWRVDGVSASGAPFFVEGVYEAVERPFLLVMTWAPAWEPGPPTRLTYRLDAVDGGTRLTVRHEGFEGRRDSCDQHTAGWERVLTWLSTHLAKTA